MNPIKKMKEQRVDPELWLRSSNETYDDNEVISQPEMNTVRGRSVDFSTQRF